MNEPQLRAVIDAIIAVVDKETAGHPILNLGVHVLAYIVDDTAVLADILAKLQPAAQAAQAQPEVDLTDLRRFKP